MVIDLLNTVPSFVHHWRVYGFWAPAIKDYVDSKVIDWMLTPENKKLMEIEEPYEYRDRLTLPKYMVNATGDQFFVPDSAQFYWEDLKGEKYIRYVPNADHSLRNTDAVPSVVAFFQTVIQDKPRPQFEWRLEKDGSIRVTAEGHAERGEAVAGVECGGTRFPADDDRSGVERFGVGGEQGRVCGEGGDAGFGMDGVLRGTHVSGAWEVSVEVHRRRCG